MEKRHESKKEVLGCSKQAEFVRVVEQQVDENQNADRKELRCGARSKFSSCLCSRRSVAGRRLLRERPPLFPKIRYGLMLILLLVLVVVRRMTAVGFCCVVAGLHPQPGADPGQDGRRDCRGETRPFWLFFKKNFGTEKVWMLPNLMMVLLKSCFSS